MNYRLQLVAGEGASFFLEDWKAGGVAIDERVVGLFDAPVRGRAEAEFNEALASYGLERVYFDFLAMVRIGFARNWRWRGVRWPREEEREAARRARDRATAILRGDLHADPATRRDILRLLQAARRTLGDPLLVHGEVTRPGGSTDRVLVYQAGVVAYDRTPHPLAFLRELVPLTASAAPHSAAAGRRDQGP